jgi:hypothetical protein
MVQSIAGITDVSTTTTEKGADSVDPAIPQRLETDGTIFLTGTGCFA